MKEKNSHTSETTGAQQNDADVEAERQQVKSRHLEDIKNWESSCPHGWISSFPRHYYSCVYSVRGSGEQPARSSEPGVLDLVLGLLRQRGDLGGLLLRRPLAGVEAVQRGGEETQPVAGAHGLLKVTRLVQQLLDGVVVLHRGALDHLGEGEEEEEGRTFTRLNGGCGFPEVMVWFLDDSSHEFITGQLANFFCHHAGLDYCH